MDDKFLDIAFNNIKTDVVISLGGTKITHPFLHYVFTDESFCIVNLSVLCELFEESKSVFEKDERTYRILHAVVCIFDDYVKDTYGVSSDEEVLEIRDRFHNHINSLRL